MVADFRMSIGSLVISDPEILAELYVSKNKYFDKCEKFKKVRSGLFGNALTVSKSDSLWAAKRKTFSAAFYK